MTSLVEQLQSAHQITTNGQINLSSDAICQISQHQTSSQTERGIYRAALGWTHSLVDEDGELEEFVSGIPGLCESEALATYNKVNDPGRTIRAVLADLPGPTSFHAPLPWSIIRLAQRAITSNLSEPIGPQRIKACLEALYYIPGATRDLLAPYAAGKYYFFGDYTAPELHRVAGDY
ncbi:hypothetical protein V8E53_011648 [Lactarius tabidus]